MSNDTDRLTITLTDRVPVRIVKAEWPVIASASDSDNREYDFQANRMWKLTVRQHADGRALVYGKYESNYANEAGKWAGQMVESGGDIVAAIRTVAEAINPPDALAQWCIADLPAQEA